MAFFLDHGLRIREKSEGKDVDAVRDARVPGARDYPE